MRLQLLWSPNAIGTIGEGAALAGKAEFPVNKKAGMLRLLNGLMLFDSRVTQAGLLARTDPAGHHVAQRGIEFCADDLRSFALGS
jgi:hypothetical protein